MKKTKLTVDGCVELINKLASDYVDISTSNKLVPDALVYKIASRDESASVDRSARMAALKEIGSPKPIKKVAFDTRRFDQETVRNPRANLQNWIRSDQFIDDETQSKVNVFARMLKPLEELKQSFGSQPEWHNSYSRTLYDHVYRILRVKEADLDIFRPQLAYLEQLMFARYRLSMDELARIREADFKEAVLKKDEALLKRGAYLHMTESPETKQAGLASGMAKDGNGLTQESIVNAIFGNNNFRRDGEKTVERTITITIRDQVVE